MPPLSDVPACRYQQSLSRCITCQDVCVQESHATKRLYRNLKWTFENLLPCYYYTIKTSSKTIRSQVWQLAPAGSSVVSPKFGGTKNLVGSKVFDLRRITLFCLWYRLSKHKWLYVLKIFWGTWPPRPLSNAYASKQRSGHEWTASSALHDTRTVNLALVQCECCTGKYPVIARNKSINRKRAADVKFSRKF